MADFRKPRRRRKPRLRVKEADINYKNVEVLANFLNDKGRIKPARANGASAKLQRKIATAIKRARNIALLPYTTTVSK
ncbi:30S ribosomal protein S18 [Propionigenium maris DSM 9537]|jgi:small subunit ribosomal protein S18|uniref:Small ribosomal subunit protein bS18 n=1 Tax=Propionigenium maris DSM 9537 TaxID=1123000 RepID=A0A9W6GPK7_9FUSO|nr:30S ribosomal protein S18 [Propionigenium maris]GLI57686.1 30S ribosomal protein S18 [Propionigenium maris DSM 9537]